MISILIAGFLLGFAGSLHCVGMCGPLSLALPTYHLAGALRLLSMLVYQLGRITTYSFLGLLFGLAGRGIYVAGVQQWFSISLGIFILVLATLYFMRGGLMHVTVLKRFYVSVSILIGKIIKHNSGVASFFLLGIANGLLPCGMVYVALAAALSFHSISGSVGFMAMFGGGTLPAMMLVAYSAEKIGPSVKKISRHLIPYFVTLTGIILIIRGLGLAIPFLSPELQPAAVNVINCHK